jgi:hypothetical protein
LAVDACRTAILLVRPGELLSSATVQRARPGEAQSHWQSLSKFLRSEAAPHGGALISLPPAIDTPFDAEPTLASIAEAPPAPRASQPRSSTLGGPAAAYSR